MQHPERLPLNKVIAYGLGGFGWSISINIISVMLLYFYLPSNDTGMPNLVPQITFLGILNIISIVLASGRLFDAVIDPIIAQKSDKSENPKGRRLPLMKLAIIPMVFFSILLFIPPVHGESITNVLWIGVIQVFYYFFFALYVIPHNALIAELGHYPKGKMHMSTAQSVGFILGVLIASATPMLADAIQAWFPHFSRSMAVQYSIGTINLLGCISMFAPVLSIDEKKYTKPAISTEPVFESLKTALGNRNFVIFAFADAAFFMAIGIITTGLMYYVKSMLRLPESTGTWLMLLMVIVTLCFYPVVNVLEKKYRKKRMIMAGFMAMIFVFGCVYWLGKMPFAPIFQGILLMVAFGIPDAFLGILPNTVVADISEDHAAKTGQNKEGMFFGMRALFQKIGQTMGIMVFAALTLYGKDPGNDMGLRYSGIIGGLLCLCAAIAYSFYKEPAKQVA